jgi:hypothetical protein
MLQTVKQFRSFADLVFFYLIEKHRYRVPWILRSSSSSALRKSGKAEKRSGQPEIRVLWLCQKEKNEFFY